MFELEDQSYKYKYLKQKLLVSKYKLNPNLQYNKTIFELHDIFGIDNNTANIRDET